MPSEKHTIYTSLMFGDAELECSITFFFYPGDPGRTYGPPEDCYPAEDPEIEIDTLLVNVKNQTKQYDAYKNADFLLENGEFYDYVESICWSELEAMSEDYDYDFDPDDEQIARGW